jgi:mannose-1-phosphate guanylyltransferase
MDAIVLAGGEGTRLRPLTEQRPKGLAPILGRPLLGLLLDHLRRHGVERVVLALTRGPASAAIVHALGDDPTLGGTLAGGAPGLELRFAFEDTPLGSGGAIANAATLLGATSDPVLVCNGDLVSDLDLSAMLAAHRAQRAELTIALCEVAEPSRFGVAALDAAGRITTFVEKPRPGTEPSNLANAGFWLFSDSLIAAMDGQAFNRVEDVLFPDLVKACRAVFGWRHAGYWRDVGTPEAYREAVMDALDRASPQAAASNWLDPSARIEASATVRHSAIGARSIVGSGATVLDSVLWEDVRVGTEARVARSVLGAGFEVPAGAVIEDACLVPPAAHSTPPSAAVRAS